MTLRTPLWILLAALLPAFPAPLATANEDAAPAKPLLSLDVEDIKVQWFSRGDEELPAWINAHFDVGPLGQISGRMTETELSEDGTDEDGDPYGFETNVFDTADGSLKDVTLGEQEFSFTTVYPGKDGASVKYAGHLSQGPSRAWSLSAASRGPKGDSAGHNRFPMAGEEKKAGALEIYTRWDSPSAEGAESL